MNQYTITSPVAEYSPKNEQWWLCPKSNLALDINYSDASILLPLEKKPNISLGEGNTPLIKLTNLSKALEIDIWAKCEFLNPTGSFKDRGSVTEISKALELNKKGVVCASTGNMAASLAAYAASLQLGCVVVVPDKTPESKLQQAQVCGAILEKVNGNYDSCVAIAQKIASKRNYFLCGDYVIRREGQKSVGWELASSGIKIDSIIVPVGNGTIGVATIKGFDEKRGTKKLPQFIGVQAEKVNPIECAWRTKEKIAPMQNGQTTASAFNVGNPLDGYLVLNWLEKSNGQMLAVADQKIIDAQKLLATKEGLFVETTAASTLAGIVKNKQKFHNQSVVLILTGSGLKERN